MVIVEIYTLTKVSILKLTMNVLADGVLGCAHEFAAILFFDIRDVYMAYNVIVNRNVLADQKPTVIGYLQRQTEKIETRYIYIYISRQLQRAYRKTI